MSKKGLAEDEQEEEKTEAGVGRKTGIFGWNPWRRRVQGELDRSRRCSGEVVVTVDGEGCVAFTSGAISLMDGMYY